jgi:D-alanyl-D-alanine carboxypeptidase
MLDLVTIFTFISLLISAGVGFISGDAGDFSYLTKNYYPAPQKIAENCQPLPATAKSLLVIDNDSGATLLEKNATTTLPIASLTKLMTALVFLDTRPDWKKKIKMEAADAREGGLVLLLAGDELTVKDLFYLMLVSSTNEAAAAIARVSGIPDFVSAMNQKAKSLGMSHTFFADFTGLDPANVSCASDLIRLGQAALLNRDIAQAVTSVRYEFFTLNGARKIKAESTDQLLNSFLNKDDYRIGAAKTGHLAEVGYNLFLTQHRRDNKNLTLILLGADSEADRWTEAKGLVECVLKDYQWQ